MPYSILDFSGVRTYPIRERVNLVTLKDLVGPDAKPPHFESKDMREVARRIVEARRNRRPVIWMMGAHVVKCGMSLIVIDLMKRGVITHVAGNGAVSIHDFEIALIGETSEDVSTAIEDGTFGMAEETGRYINEAIIKGAEEEIGYGESIGRMIAERWDFPYKFPHKDCSILATAYELGIPATIHATIGTDIIHQHPLCDFGAIGETSGWDFRIFAASVSKLEGGVFCNFGSAVTGPEVFLKALSVSRNLGYKVEVFTTANFDLIDLGDYRRPVGKDEPDYYYRPRKNIVNRPTSTGGRGFHIVGDHAVTIPNLYKLIREGLG
ncbi:MAG: hypothetical protein ACUVXI_02820 [bacterium]